MRHHREFINKRLPPAPFPAQAVGRTSICRLDRRALPAFMLAGDQPAGIRCQVVPAETDVLKHQFLGRFLTPPLYEFQQGGGEKPEPSGLVRSLGVRLTRNPTPAAFRSTAGQARIASVISSTTFSLRLAEVSGVKMRFLVIGSCVLPTAYTKEAAARQVSLSR